MMKVQIAIYKVDGKPTTPPAMPIPIEQIPAMALNRNFDLWGDVMVDLTIGGHKFTVRGEDLKRAADAVLA